MASVNQEKPRGLWSPAIVAGVLMALCFIRAMSWQYLDEKGSALRLTPRGEHLQAALAIAIPLFPAMALLWSAITRRLKARLVVVLVLLTVLGAVGGFFSVWAWSPLFGGQYRAVAISPDGKLEAHLRESGLLGCNATVYIAERRGIWGTASVERTVDCDSMGVRWLADGGVEITGDGPKPLNLNFGPH